MARSAYYSRNNSYSRSYNAEVAESEGRYPLTRALQAIGISAKTFKDAQASLEIYTSEWHHVGKYANRVDYWDVADLKSNHELWFWIFKNKKGASKNTALGYLKKIAKNNVKEKCFVAIKVNRKTYEAKQKQLEKRAKQYRVPVDLCYNKNLSHEVMLDIRRSLKKTIHEKAASKIASFTNQKKSLKDRLYAYKSKLAADFQKKWHESTRNMPYTAVMTYGSWPVEKLDNRIAYHQRSTNCIYAELKALTNLSHRQMDMLFDYAVGKTITTEGRWCGRVNYSYYNIYTNSFEILDKALLKLEEMEVAFKNVA